MKHIVNLIVGDWAHEGHGKSSIVTIRSSLNKSEINDAYVEGSKRAGFSFLALDGCAMSKEETDMLEEAGIDTSCIDYCSSDGAYTMDEDTFVEIYLAIVGLGDDTFEWERISHEENHIRIGGYNIFV